MEYAELGELKGFDLEYDISLSAVLTEVKEMHPKATSLTIRKFIVGAVIREPDSHLQAYAESYEESFVRVDCIGSYRAEPEKFTQIPNDFWRIGMALDPDAEACFRADTLGNEADKTASELPYNLRNRVSGQLDNERVTLFQLARGIHFPRARILALASDPGWQAWANTENAIGRHGKRGRPRAWKWDEVKVALTIEASRYPEILSKGVGPIVQFMNDELRRLHHDQLPNQEEVYAYARLFSGLWGPPDPGPP